MSAVPPRRAPIDPQTAPPRPLPRSLALRLVFALPVAWLEVPAVGDELDYLSRADGYRALIAEAIGGPPASEADARRAYGHGRRPPLYPVFLALVFLVFPPLPGVARLASTVVSAATTPLVYRTSSSS